VPAQGRLGDKSSANVDAHGCPACPHPATGPAIIGSTNVNVNRMPALRVGDGGLHMACCGPNTWEAKAGSATVFINNKAAHRQGDACKHCGGMGKLIEGSPNVMTGGATSSGGGSSSSGSGSSNGAGGGGGGGGSGGGSSSTTSSSGGSSSSASSSPASSSANEQQEQRWVEIELVDEEGQPAAGIRVRVTPSAGPAIEVTTDEQGIARASDIEPGECTITLPDLDESAWS
jgi:uncharacterized Zn-binding protein involved in type VI secretion